MALGKLDRVVITRADQLACLDLALSRHLRLVSPELPKSHRTSNNAENHGNSAFCRYILNIRSINIAEIALDFN
ncbi:MAG: hypothetical protein E5V94_14275, partial [Mesorhizobium sp.]